MMAHFVILRHGKTEINEWNEQHPTERRIGGQRESPLLPEGEASAREAGRQIARMPWIDIQLAISSDLQRAIRTRDLVLEQLPKQGIPTHAIQGLREIDYGKFAGRNEAEVQQEHPELFDDPNDKKWKGDFDRKALGGENYEDVGRRLDTDVFPLLAEENGDILVVSHLHALRVFLYKVLGLTREKTYILKIPHAKPIVIERGNPYTLIEPTLEQLFSRKGQTPH